MSQLKDIKPIVAITDDSLIYFLTIVFIILLITVFFYWKSRKAKHNDNRKNAIIKLQELDYSNSKMVAYDFKKYAEQLCRDDNKTQFEQINHALERYKYKKQVDRLDPNLIQKIKEFIDV